MKNTILLILLIIGIFIKSQTHRYIYELQFKYDSTEADRAKVNMVLDITPKEVKFYGEDLLVTDSINKKMGSQNKYFDMSGQIVKRKVNSFENENFISIKFNYYTYKTTDKISWNISGETKKIQGYTLQKATTKFGGRNWTAWFNKDIPFNEGPFKFRNLPGLIFELQDDHQNFIYTLVKNKNLPGIYSTNDFLETFFGSKAVPITEQQKQKLLLEYYNDPFAFERNNFSKNNADWKININGKEIRSIDELNTQTKNMQELIKKYNNPVELDKAMHYPD
ncbi:GLPGLI family protein [Elizabethkingia meningoseptica]|uniref:GLPGLI family protein n=2 Tax=Elizabethkingia meningoseptica TaxID=238 RepID=UPI0009357F25|nr:GLPGLI family protein [Elizabethkingia meningoseptica]EJK5329978.1 GLPGLI family protein [Elizabethkingia meningoseptica]MCL1674225.1 GLPGLI family protein [Elizabethkingia meningoseptica]MCL1685134.1 GLPGLI family protein [Elizabethkingia meningoseptica]MDE5439225.1 GLPGLI family protein [Elizabethkingia meningoseptica]MDE5468576.1 GLPGLI family protein [Elizabethkingia meningoseptica]